MEIELKAARRSPKKRIDNKKGVLMGISCLVLIVIGIEIPYVSVAAFLLSAVYVVFSDISDSLSLMFLLLPFANIFKISPDSTALFTYLELVFVFISFIKLKKIQGKFLISWILLLLVFILGCKGNFNTLVKQAMIPMIIYIGMSVEDNTVSVTKSFSLGLLLSSIVASLSKFLPHLVRYMRIVKAYEISADLTRFTALYSDPNYYSVSIVIAIMGLFILLNEEKISKIWWAIGVALLVYGLTTLSKSYYLTLAIVFVFGMYTLLRFRKYRLFILGIAFVVVLGVLIMNGKLLLFQRMLIRLGTNDISTGRFQIWSMYLKYFTETVPYLFFGRGIGASYLKNIAPHNTFIDFIYFYGIAGSILFIVTIMIGVRWKFSKKIYHYFPAICLIIMSLFLSYAVMFDFAFLILLSITFFQDRAAPEEEICRE